MSETTSNNDFTTADPDDPTTVDPGIAGSEAERQAESARTEARSSTANEIGRNSSGDPYLSPSDRDALMRQHNLTAPEAEALWDRTTNSGSEDADTVAEEIRGNRVYYRQSYEQVPADATVVPGAALPSATVTDAELDKQKAERERLQSAANAPTVDKTQPEAGPYGPFADYDKKTKSAEEVATEGGISLDDAEKVLENTPSTDK